MRLDRVAAIAVLAAASPSWAETDIIPGHRVDRPTDGAITAVSLAGTLAVSQIPLREDTKLWSRELFAIDATVKDHFSRRAAHVSDGLLALSLAAPAIYLTGSTIDDVDGDRLVLYGQTLAVNGLLAQAAKYIVQRPRPYMYGTSPAAKAYAAEQGAEGRRSFYSGHAALSFGAAVTGAYLLGASSDQGASRAVAWGAGLMVASATANLRVRAGKHFYSDVVIGAAVGMAVGYAVPALHAEDRPYLPSGQELAAAAAGILGGLLISQLLPLEKPRTELSDLERSPLSRLQLAPMPIAHGMGFAIGGAL